MASSLLRIIMVLARLPGMYLSGFPPHIIFSHCYQFYFPVFHGFRDELYDFVGYLVHLETLNYSVLRDIIDIHIIIIIFSFFFFFFVWRIYCYHLYLFGLCLIIYFWKVYLLFIYFCLVYLSSFLFIRHGYYYSFIGSCVFIYFVRDIYIYIYIYIYWAMCCSIFV